MLSNAAKGEVLLITLIEVLPTSAVTRSEHKRCCGAHSGVSSLLGIRVGKRFVGQRVAICDPNGRLYQAEC